MGEREVIAAVAAALGLRGDDDRSGLVDGVQVTLRRAWSDRSNYSLLVQARPAFGLDLGLWVRQAGLFLGGAPRPVGDARFDGVFDVIIADGHDAEARALLQPRLRELLLDLLGVGQVDLTDELVALRVSTLHLTVEALRAHVDACVAAARDVDAFGATLPAPTTIPAEYVDAVADACRDLGLASRAHPLSAWGRSASGALSARCRSRAAPWPLGAMVASPVEPLGYGVAASFDEPLGAGLRVEPAGLGDRLKDLVGLGDLSLGVPDFDRRWRVRATNPELAAALLHDEARASLDALRALGLRFTLDDRGLAGRGDPPTRVEQIPEVLRRVASLREVMRARTSAGPYR